MGWDVVQLLFCDVKVDRLVGIEAGKDGYDEKTAPGSCHDGNAVGISGVNVAGSRFAGGELFEALGSKGVTIGPDMMVILYCSNIS